MNPSVTFDPEACILINDNIQAMKVITDFGVLNQLVPKPPNNVAHFTFQTPTHFGCASNHVGFSKESDNGYCVVLLPKKRFTFIDASQFLAEVLDKSSVNGKFEFSLIDVAPLGNN